MATVYGNADCGSTKPGISPTYPESRFGLCDVEMVLGIETTESLTDGTGGLDTGQLGRLGVANS